MICWKTTFLVNTVSSHKTRKEVIHFRNKLYVCVHTIKTLQCHLLVASIHFLNSEKLWLAANLLPNHGKTTKGFWLLWVQLSWLFQHNFESKLCTCKPCDFKIFFFFSSKPSCLKPKSLSVENIDFWQWSVSMAETSCILLHGTGSWWRVGIIVLLSESLCFTAVFSNRLSSVPVIAHIPPDCLETRHGDDSADGALLYRANSCLAVWYTHIPLMIK